MIERIVEVQGPSVDPSQIDSLVGRLSRCSGQGRVVVERFETGRIVLRLVDTADPPSPELTATIRSLGRVAKLTVNERKILTEPFVPADERDLTSLAELIRDPKRRLPVVVLGGKSPIHGCPLDPDRLATVLAGTVECIAVLDSAGTRSLERILGHGTVPYGGAARVHAPMGRTPDEDVTFVSAKLVPERVGIDRIRRAVSRLTRKPTASTTTSPKKRAKRRRLHEITGSDEVVVPFGVARPLDYPDRWDAIPAWVERHFGGRVVLAATARRNVGRAVYHRPRVAAAALHWLADVARERLLHGGGDVSDGQPVLPGVRAERSGVFGIPESVVDGEVYRGTRKIRGGNSRDPRYCLRIYWTWDPQRERIVVVDMPFHTRNRMT